MVLPPAAISNSHRLASTLPGTDHVEKQGMSLVPRLDPAHLDRPVHDTDNRPVQTGPFDQQQHPLLIWLNPPCWRLDGLDRLSRGGQSLSEHSEEQDGPERKIVVVS